MNSRLNSMLAVMSQVDDFGARRMDIAGRTGLARTLIILLTHSGDVLPVLVILVALLVWGAPDWQGRAVRLLIADAATFALTQGLKFLIRRRRPDGEWGEFYRRIDPHSFPSGHAARGGALGVMALLLGPWWLALIGLPWGIGLALSRVWMGVHYLSDSLIGFLIGAVVAVLVFTIS